jgi:hypothetical protein
MSGAKIGRGLDVQSIARQEEVNAFGVRLRPSRDSETSPNRSAIGWEQMAYIATQFATELGSTRANQRGRGVTGDLENADKTGR